MKKLLVVLLSVLMVISMTACSSSDDTPAEKTTVTIWGTWTDDQVAALNEYIEAFNASSDKYTVVYEGQVYSGYSDTLKNAVNAKTGPDLVIDYASTAATFHELGQVVDLSQYVTEEEIAQLTDGAKTEATSFEDGGMYCFPIILSGPVLWYNPAILEAAGVEVPTTWQEVFEVSEVIHSKVTVVTDSEGNPTYVTDGSGSAIAGFASDSHTDFIQTIIMQLGQDLYDTTTATCTFNNDAVATYLTAYQTGVNDGSIMSGPTGDYLSNDFNSGIVAMYFGSVAGEPYLTVDHAAAKVPGIENGTAWTPAWQRGVLVFDYADQDRIDGAVAFLEYFISAEVNEDWCERCNYQSCLKWTQELDSYKEFLANNSSLSCLEPEIAGSFPAIPAISYVRTALKNLVNTVGAGTDVHQALQEAVDYVAENQ